MISFLVFLFAFTITCALYIFGRGVYPYALPIWFTRTAFILLIVFSQSLLITRIVMRSGVEFPLIILRGVSFILMSMMFVFGLLILRDIFLLFFHFISRITGINFSLSHVLAGGKTVVFIFLFAIGANAFGMYKAIKVPDIKDVTLTIPNLPNELKGLEIVLLADLHIGSAFDKAWLQDVVDKVNSMEADFVVLSGDLIDESVDIVGKEVTPIGDIQSKYGFYMAFGNHENYSGPLEWKEYLENLGVNVLINENRVFDFNGAKISIIGVGDPSRSKGTVYGTDHVKALENVPEDAIKILLGHQPVIAKNSSTYGYDVQLAGHTHGGQAFFLDPMMKSANDGFVSGHYNVGDMQLYVSNGTGLWGGGVFRFGRDSEITRIKLQ